MHSDNDMQDTWLTMLNNDGVATLSSISGVLGIFRTPEEPSWLQNTIQGVNQSSTVNMTRPGATFKQTKGAANKATTVTVDVAVSFSNPSLSLSKKKFNECSSLISLHICIIPNACILKDSSHAKDPCCAGLCRYKTNTICSALTHHHDDSCHR
jgi:hypothetical protein